MFCLGMVQDNLALDALAAEQLKGTGAETPTVAHMNGLVAGVMAATTAPVRFPGTPLQPRPSPDTAPLA